MSLGSEMTLQIFGDCRFFAFALSFFVAGIVSEVDGASRELLQSNGRKCPLSSHHPFCLLSCVNDPVIAAGEAWDAEYFRNRQGLIKIGSLSWLLLFSNVHMC
jgi:hypothetical protein